MIAEYDLRYNYQALLACICAPATPDDAISAMGISPPVFRAPKIDRDTVQQMAQMKQTMTYDEVAQKFGVCRETVYRHIKKYRGDRQ